MKQLSLTIAHLYPDLMNIYGDIGNIIALKKRCEWRGIEVSVKNISLKDKLKEKEADLFFFGGGQDQQQNLVSADLSSSGKGEIIKKEVERGVPLLSVCGGYQLLGEYYQPHKGAKLEGVGLFPIFTKASFERMIGNIVITVNSQLLTDNSKTTINYEQLTMNNYLVGFENHSGKTYLKKSLPAGRQEAKPLGKIIKGFGNNGDDQTEGIIYKNAIGCYMHGSLLPKNPFLADWLIKKALEVKYDEEINLEPLDDSLENSAHNLAISRFS